MDTDPKLTRPDIDLIARNNSPDPGDVRRMRRRGRVAFVILALSVAATVLFGFYAYDSATSEINGLSSSQSDAARAAQALEQQVVALGAKPVVAAPTPVVGPAGAQGPTGTSGRGITGTAVADGDLLVTYSDGNTQNVGPVVGPTGAAGRGIAGVSIASGDLVITYTDGTTTDLGTVVGPMGLQGVAGPTGAQGPAGTNGVDGTNGTNGVDGATGAPGPAGADGAGVGGFTFTDELGSTYNCTPDQTTTSAHYTCTAG